MEVAAPVAPLADQLAQLVAELGDVLADALLHAVDAAVHVRQLVVCLRPGQTSPDHLWQCAYLHVALCARACTVTCSLPSGKSGAARLARHCKDCRRNMPIQMEAIQVQEPSRKQCNFVQTAPSWSMQPEKCSHAAEGMLVDMISEPKNRMKDHLKSVVIC